MKKVLIISYFFPPCNLTAAQRIQGWADHLNQFGYYPVVITRNWDITIQQPEDVLRSSGDTIKTEKTETHEVHYLPYKASFRDRYFYKTKGSFLQKFSRVFTFANLILENYRLKSIPHHNLYDFSRTLLKKGESFEALIISGNPFNQYFFGYKLEKEFSIPWIADYRDDWSTSKLQESTSGLNKIVQNLQSKSERKWVASASLITSVSDIYTQRISDFVGVPGRVLLNGFDTHLDVEGSTQKDRFIITYNGSLYPSQAIESFLEAIQKLIENGYSEIELKFPGLAFNPKQAERVRKASESFSDHVTITERIPKKDVIELQSRSDLLLMLPHEGLKGIPSSKMYEYIGLRKEVILFPSDDDIIQDTLKTVELDVICNSTEELYNTLELKILEKRKGQQIASAGNAEAIAKFSKVEQVKVLAELIKALQ